MLTKQVGTSCDNNRDNDYNYDNESGNDYNYDNENENENDYEYYNYHLNNMSIPTMKHHQAWVGG